MNSKMDDQYAFLGAIKAWMACSSHFAEKPASYFFGNTNFEVNTEEGITTFTCLRCSTTYQFKKLSERTIL